VILAALDTATPSTVAGVMLDDSRVIEARDDPVPGARPRHASRAIALLEEALAAAGASWEEVDRLAVGVGPGGFTGLRIGIATARALAQGRRLELAAVSSLQALARPHGAAASAIDARRGEVFGAVWTGGRCVLEPGAWEPAEFAGRAADAVPGPLLAVGDGAMRYREVIEAAGLRVAPEGDAAHRITAGALCRLGRCAVATDRDSLMPDYLREPDAVPPSRA
jgi:tRNA threonylcarbamoyladenosine biosynthesis protein TsaB